MSIMFLSATEYQTGKTIEFNTEHAKKGGDKHLKKIYDALVFREKLSFGEIHQQQDNNDLWYFNPQSTIARFITKDQLELFHKWDKESLLPTEQQFKILEEIGGLPSPPFYSREPNYIEFPAKVVTNTGQEIDLCLFHFSEAPPYQSYFKKVLLLSDIADIKPSELALNHDLRIASTLVEEVRMSFYPFMVETNKGRLITYNGITQFASLGEIKGNEIISTVEFTHANLDKIIDISWDHITFIIGKWDDRFEALHQQYRQKQGIKERTSANTDIEPPKQKWWKKLFSFK